MYQPVKTKQLKYYSSVLLLLILLKPPALFSMPDNEAIQIQADTMKLDLETGSSNYRGNVSIIQGTIKLTGDTVIVTRKNNQIHDIKVDGQPARYLQDENTDNQVRAISQYMKYTVQTHRLVLTGNASVEQSNQTVVSQRIVYDTQNKIIIAGKNNDPENTGQSSDRVNITLTPQKDAPEKPSAENK